MKVHIQASMPISAKWDLGEESRYYLQKNSLPVLCIEAQGAGVITTGFEFIS